MIPANFHKHTNFSDGSHHPEIYIERAIAQQLIALGFSDHAPFPYKNSWSIEDQTLDDYILEIKQLKKLYQVELQIYCGIEVEYIPNLVSVNDPLFENPNIDYTIGSIHYVDHFEDGTPWSIDGTEAIFKRGLQKIFKGDIRAAVYRYF